MAERGEARAWLGLGSNVGDRLGHLRFAVEKLEAVARVEQLSSVYETEPVGFPDQGPFLNAVIRIATRLSPRELLDQAARIEAARARVRTFPNAPRTLDVDLLLYEDRVVREPGLEVPHPRMTGRPFVLIPLTEVDPGLRDPVSGRTYAELLGAMDVPAGDVVRTTRSLRGRGRDDASG